LRLYLNYEINFQSYANDQYTKVLVTFTFADDKCSKIARV